VHEQPAADTERRHDSSLASAAEHVLDHEKRVGSGRDGEERCDAGEDENLMVEHARP